MDSNYVPTDTEMAGSLEAWTEAIEREIADIRGSMTALQQRLDAANEKRDLVRRLLHLSTPPLDRALEKTEQPQCGPHPACGPAIEDHIEDVLLSKGTPTHIREIRAALIEMGVPLPGKGDEANIILRLRRDDNRFVRTGRGTYALVAWELPAYSPAPRKKKISRRGTVKQ